MTLVKKRFLLATFLFLVSFFPFGFSSSVWAEDKPPGQAEYVEETPGGPELGEAIVYPYAGLPCTRYTYRTVYRDKKGRPPEYVRLWLNGEWHEMTKGRGENWRKGVEYTYQIVPHQAKTHFYYMVASNGIGVSRTGIIDSPNNGPQLFAIPLDQNKIALFNQSGNLLWSFDTGKDWVTKVALSGDGRYLAAKTNDYLYLFSTSSNKLLWQFSRKGAKGTFEAPYGGVAISQNGQFIAAALGQEFLLFSKDSNQPLIQESIDSEAYGVAITPDGRYAAAAGFRGLFLFSREKKKRLWLYEAGSNFHGVAITPDGQYLAGTTGCPDRRAYIFKKDSPKPIFKSERLTRDSPLKAAAFSSDGRQAFFTADNDQGRPILFGYDFGKNKISWEFKENPQRVSRTVDSAGNFVALGGLSAEKGKIYLLDKNGKSIWDYQVGRKVASVDLSVGGQYLAAGANDGKVYFFSTESNQPRWWYQLPVWINTVSVSDDGHYLAAGTGTSVYFYETGDEPAGPVLECGLIYEPPETEDFGDDLASQFPKGRKDSLLARIKAFFQKIIGWCQGLFRKSSNGAVCGNSLCEPDLGETGQNCPRDCSGGN